MIPENLNEGGDGGLPPRTGSPSSLTPETDAIFSHIALANHPETDGEHFRAFMESARNGVEALEHQRNYARKILHDIEEIFLTMRPRHCGHPSMDGRYPCWIVWLPKEGTVERKSLTEAIMEFVAQTAIIPENANVMTRPTNTSTNENNV